MNSIEAAIAAAQNAAANLPAQVPGAAPAVPAPLVTSGAPITLQDLMQGGLNVDHWLKISAYGLSIGQNKAIFSELDLAIRLGEIGYCWGIKYGNPAHYDKTYDGVTSVKGGSWGDAVARGQKIDPKCRPYRSADIPFTALNDISTPKDEVLVRQGQTLGYSLSTTSWGNFAKFVQELTRKNADLKNDIVKVTVGFEVRQKQGVNDWGVPTFSNVELLEALPWEND